MERDGCVFVRVVGIRRRPTMGIERRKGKAFPQFPAWEDGTPNSPFFFPISECSRFRRIRDEAALLILLSHFWVFFTSELSSAIPVVAALGAFILFYPGRGSASLLV